MKNAFISIALVAAFSAHAEWNHTISNDASGKIALKAEQYSSNGYAAFLLYGYHEPDPMIMLAFAGPNKQRALKCGDPCRINVRWADEQRMKSLTARYPVNGDTIAVFQAPRELVEMAREKSSRNVNLIVMMPYMPTGQPVPMEVDFSGLDFERFMK